MLMPRARDKISFFVGLILFVVGGIPLAGTLGLIDFTLPDFLAGAIGSIAVWIIAIAGAYVFIDGLIEPKTHQLHAFLMIVGFLLLVVGLIPILHNFGYIGFSLGFLDNLIVYNTIITLEGILLIQGAFTMH